MLQVRQSPWQPGHAYWGGIVVSTHDPSLVHSPGAVTVSQSPLTVISHVAPLLIWHVLLPHTPCGQTELFVEQAAPSFDVCWHPAI